MGITKALLLVVVVFAMAFIPFIAYIDYYCLKGVAVCPRCGLEPNKHSFLLATVLEMFMFIAGMLIGILVD